MHFHTMEDGAFDSTVATPQTTGTSFVASITDQQSQHSSRTNRDDNAEMRRHLGHVDGLTDCSESEGEDGLYSAVLQSRQRGQGHLGSATNIARQYYHLNDTRQLSQWSRHSQMSLLYSSNQQLADVPEELQDQAELSASIVGQYRDRSTLYKVVVQHGNRTWFVLRRYCDFALLNQKLQKQFVLFHFELPQRRIDQSKFTHAFIDERQHALDTYLKNLLVHKEFANCTDVKRFLKVDDPPRLEADVDAIKMFCQDLQLQNNILYRQLQAANVEIIAAREGKLPPGPNPIPSFGSSRNVVFDDEIKEYQNALKRAKDEEERVKQNLEDFQRELKAEAFGAREASKGIVERKEALMKEQMENFDKLHVNIHDQLNAVCKEVTGGSQEGSNGVTAKTDELKKVIEDWETSLRNHHQQMIEAFEKEVSSLRLDVAKKAEVIKAKDDEIRQQREERHQNKLWFNHDLAQKRDRIKSLVEQLRMTEKRCLYAEEHYFFALFIGAKLSVSMSDQRSPFLNVINPQELFENIKQENVAIKKWPNWIAQQMYL